MPLLKGGTRGHTGPSNSLRDRLLCTSTRGQREALDHDLGTVERKENPCHLSVGKQTGNWRFPRRQKGPHQIPTLRMQEDPSFPSLPAAPSKWRGRRLPLVGLRLPQHSLEGQEHQLNTIKILEH